MWGGTRYQLTSVRTWWLQDKYTNLFMGKSQPVLGLPRRAWNVHGVK